MSMRSVRYLWSGRHTLFQAFGDNASWGAFHGCRAFKGTMPTPSTIAMAATAPSSFISLSDMYKLSKGRLSIIVMATAAAGFAAGSAQQIDVSKLAWTCVGTFACSAAANTLNQIYEVRNDGSMRRTMLRPLPAGRVSIAQAAMFAIACATAGSAALAIQVCLPQSVLLDVPAWQQLVIHA